MGATQTSESFYVQFNILSQDNHGWHLASGSLKNIWHRKQCMSAGQYQTFHTNTERVQHPQNNDGRCHDYSHGEFSLVVVTSLISSWNRLQVFGCCPCVTCNSIFSHLKESFFQLNTPNLLRTSILNYWGKSFIGLSFRFFLKSPQSICLFHKPIMLSTYDLCQLLSLR